MKKNIDLVYLWVDGNDAAWQSKRNAFIGNTRENSAENCEGRYANNDELKYSLRSVEKYATWIRKIFIVTDNQTPDWLNIENPKIKIIDHKDIMPPESLPCFNSALIEHFLYKIPDLSEHFLYANDDTFINKFVTSDTFFAPDGLPIIRLQRKWFRKLYWFFREKVQKKPLDNYRHTIRNAAELVKKKYGIFYNGKPHHNIDACLKSTFQLVAAQTFKDEIRATFSNHVRSTNDIQRVIYSYVALAEKRGHLRYSSKKFAFHLHIQTNEHYMKLKKYNPTLFCMNDSQYARDSDRAAAIAFLNKCFPEKSQFEK
jgi:hypothetical protein